MTRGGLVGYLSRDGASSFAALLLALDQLEDAGLTPPCRGPRAHWWTSEDSHEREAATHGCAACPALTTCQTHAPAESWHVWAGNDRTSTTRSKPSERKTH